MIATTWVQYTWKLAGLPATVPKIDERYHVESATLDNLAALQSVVTSSLALEPFWGRDQEGRLKLAEEIIHTAFPAGEVTVIVIKHGARIIASTAIRDAADKLSNLPLGVCVLNEYRCRGLGTVLLYEGLRRLRDRGLEHARLVTKKGLPAERFLYTKFGSTRVVLTGIPA